MRCWIISILVILTWSSHIGGQQASDRVSYEWQTVAVVDLVVDPNVSVESLRPLVQKRTDEPYSDSKVESTIAALKTTGRFTAVEVGIQPDPGGLHATFTLEPALYLGVFDFPGACKGFSYTRLLQVIDIPNQTPYRAAKASLVFYPKNKGYELQLEAPGIKLAKLLPVQERNLGINGVLTATASGHGTIDDPQLTASVQTPQLQVRQASIPGIKADLKVATQRAQLALDSEVAQSFVQARGTLELTGGHYMHATLDTKGMPIEGLLALYAPAKTNAPRGIVEVHASAEGPLSDKNRMQAQVVVPTLKADYQGLQIVDTRPIRVRYADSIVTLVPTEIAGDDTNLRLEGQLPLEGNAPVTLSAVGAIDMQLLRFVQPDLQSSGKLLFNVHGSGATTNPTLKGQLRLEKHCDDDARFAVGTSEFKRSPRH